MPFFKSVTEQIETGAAWAKRTSAGAVREASNAAAATRDALGRAAQRTKDAAAAAATAAAQKAREGAEWTRDRAVEGAEWTKKKAREAAAWANKKGQQATNWAAGKAAAGIGSAATRSKTVERCLEGALRSKDRKTSPEDGQYMGNDCPKTSPNPPKTGRLPEGCLGHGGKLPKIIYTNGINTPPAAACATMRKIANERCAEVIGVYNATYGTVEDGLDSKNNIDRTGKEPAAKSQARLMAQMLTARPPQPVTIYAHSQGGLITQEGLIGAKMSMQQNSYDYLRKQGVPPVQAKKQAAQLTHQRMSNVDVYSFGTAEKNWPDTGTRYHQFTNTADPVPKLISSVQANRGPRLEPTNLAERHRFEKNAWDPIAPHSMDDAYIPELGRIRPVPKKANGRCC